VRIRLIETKSGSHNVYDHSLLPRLGLPLIGRILANQGHDVRIYVEAMAPVDWGDLLSADLIGFSTTTATTPPAYAMADALRAQGKAVVFGGAHVTFLPDEALEHADYVVCGEGHSTIVELVDAMMNDGDLSDIAGLSYHGPDGPVHGSPRPICDSATFASLPWPDTTLIVGHERMHTIPIMTQWGCPFDCNFCSVIKMFGRKVRARPIEDVLDELETVPPGKSVFFYDDNFVVDKRRTKALLRGMIERDINISWSAQMRAEAVYKSKRTGELDVELLELMRDTHCIWAYCGFESVNPAALEEYNKQQTVEHISESIEAFHAYGIPIHGMFVLGSDADTRKTIKETVKFAIKHAIDTVQFLNITPLPGTAFYEQMKAAGRIISFDWSLYDGHHVVTQPAKMTAYKLQRASLRAMLRFYAPIRAWKKLFGNVRRELPFLVRLYIGERKLRIAIPRIALMSLRPSRWLDIPTVLQQAIDRINWLRVRAVFIVPMFRRYAYRHTRRGMRMPRTRQYIAWLRSLTRPRRRTQQI
jgi:radical SAM superfamily enzyme YgiQ (UPF0313 family)